MEPVVLLVEREGDEVWQGVANIFEVLTELEPDFVSDSVPVGALLELAQAGKHARGLEVGPALVLAVLNAAAAPDVDGAVAKARAAVAELMEESAHLDDVVGKAAVRAGLLELRFAGGTLVPLLAAPVARREAGQRLLVGLYQNVGLLLQVLECAQAGGVLLHAFGDVLPKV